MRPALIALFMAAFLSGYGMAASAQGFDLGDLAEDWDPLGLPVIGDLAVGERARVVAADLCEKDGQLWLPRLSALLDGETGDPAVYVMVTRKPGNSVTIETDPRLAESDSLRLVLSYLVTPRSCEYLELLNNMKLELFMVTSVNGAVSAAGLIGQFDLR